jgi:hypothetical protein
LLGSWVAGFPAKVIQQPGEIPPGRWARQAPVAK